MKFLIFVFLIFCSTASTSPKLDRNPKIFHGENAEIEEFPGLVAMVHLTRATRWCGATLISEQWVLTAAHCYVPPSDFAIEYSTSDIQITNPGAKLAFPELFIRHEKFNWNDLSFDIGLVKLLEPLDTGLHMKLAKLAVPGSYYPTGTPATVTGWGSWDMSNFTQPYLQKVNLQIWHYRDCQIAFKDFSYDVGIFPHHICAGFLPDFSKGPCSGDSGGPLYVHGVQVGIVSWGVNPCDTDAYPSVYAEVSFFIPWIQEMTGIDFELQNFLIRRK